MIKYYLSSVLLDNQRWAEVKRPDVVVSEIVEDVVAKGFAGIELWEYHYTHAPELEREKLQANADKIAIYNSYCSMSDDDEQWREQVIKDAMALNVKAIKYNIGADKSQWETYQKNLVEFVSMIPSDIKLLCECHPGTVVDDPAQAKRFFTEAGLDDMPIIVHPFSLVESLDEWMTLFGSSVQHMHLQMRSEDDYMSFALFEKRPELVEQAKQIWESHNYAGTFSFEFTEGTGKANDNLDTMLTNTTRDLEYFHTSSQ